MPKNLLVRNSKRFALREWNSSAGPTETDEKACLIASMYRYGKDPALLRSATERIRTEHEKDYTC